MLNKPRCQKATNQTGKQALYCEGRFLCAHQYNCPQTRQYENTPGFQECKRLQPQNRSPSVGYHQNVIPRVKNLKSVEQAPDATTVLPSGMYVRNVIPNAEGKAVETISGKEEATHITKQKKETQNGKQVRKSRSRKRKEG